MRLVPAIGYPHRRRVVRVRVTVGVWLLVAAAILCANSHWWGVVLLAPAALHFYLAYRVLRRMPS